MKYSISTFGALMIAGAAWAGANAELVDLVNPLMGTDSSFELSNGNTYPAIARPWGMNFWTPQTSNMGDGWCYKYGDHKICGFKQTHQPSPWINDYAAFSLMPITGRLEFKENDRASWFSHKAEVAHPHYYKVYLADYDVTTELTPTDRSVSFRFTFPDSAESYILLDGYNGGSMVKVIPSERKVVGYCRNNHGGVPQNFKNWFVAEFDKPFEVVKTWNGDDLKTDKQAEGDHVGAVIGFKTKNGEQVNVKVASSFISLKQAELNLSREIGKKSFDEVESEGAAVWEKELSRIRVEGGTEDQRETFYSCLYRTMLFPRKFYELDASNKVVHYSPFNGDVLSGYLYADTGFWDSYRSLIPFVNLVFPTVGSQIQEGLLNSYLESGFYPEWASPGHRDCMVGNGSASVIADAYVKGLVKKDPLKMYEGMVYSTNHEHPDVKSSGRLGVEYYNELGYVPYDVGIRDNASRTLEYAYDDWCVLQVAKRLNRPAKEIEIYRKRCLNYKNQFNEKFKMMSGRKKDGSFPDNFKPESWWDAFTEGNSWHYTWSVFHDIQGLIDLMGGQARFIKTLDAVFSSPPSFGGGDTKGNLVHEMREMQVIDMGQYAHGNQPIQHMIYLYNYAGQPWKTQYWIRQAMERLYQPTPDGYCGDEDNGQTSAWYVFGAMGFYPVCPGTDEYVFGAPLFNKITMELENGNTFVINAPDNSESNFFVDQTALNGKEYQKSYITYGDIQKGGALSFRMVDKPNKMRCTSPASFPYSMTTED